MKKVLFLGLCFICLLVGCGTNYEKIMGKYVEKYYNDLMKKQNVTIDVPTISINDLKHTNEVGKTNFDLKKLDKCKDTSYVEIKLKKDSKEIDELIYHLDCK